MAEASFGNGATIACRSPARSAAQRAGGSSASRAFHGAAFSARNASASGTSAPRSRTPDAATPPTSTAADHHWRFVSVTGTACMSQAQQDELAKLRPELEVVRHLW